MTDGKVRLNRTFERSRRFCYSESDGLWAYQLAVVVDDGFQGVTHVVRGADLIDNTPRQILLQIALGLTTPGYMHIPLVLDKKGNKLSKQTLAPAIDRSKPEEEAARAWTHLDSNLLLSILSTSFIQRLLSAGDRDSKSMLNFCGLFPPTEQRLLSSLQRQILRNFGGPVSFQKDDPEHKAA